MYDMGVYPLNAARYSSGMEPVAVTARASTTRPEIYTEVEEMMEFDLEFPGGVVAKCEMQLDEMIDIALVDGEFSRAERELIKYVAHKLGFTHHEAEATIDEHLRRKARG